MTTEQKQAERIKAQQYAELMGEAYVDPYPDAVDDNTQNDPNKNKPLENQPIVTPTGEMTEEQLLAELKRRNITVNSLNDLLPKQTEEEQQAAIAKRKSDMLAFGLQTGKFKAEEYDSFQAAQANKLSVVKDEIAEAIKKAHPELTEQQVAEKVAIYAFENLEEGDVLRVQREKELLEMADSKLKNKFKNIYSLESDFDQYEQGINNKTNLENKVKAALPVYQKDVASILEGLKVLQVPVTDTKNPENTVMLDVKFSDTDLKELGEALLTPDNIVRQVKGGYTVEQLQKEAKSALLIQHWDRLIVQAAKDYNSKQKDKYIHGRKGVMPNGQELDISDDNLDSTKQEQYQQLIDSMPKS